jgi:hypothetical protein
MVAAGLLTYHYVHRVTEWRVMTDELLYVKLALGIWNHGRLEVHGEPAAVYSLLYSLLISPLVGLLSPPSAYRLVLILNVVLMASTAVPTYLLARMSYGWRAGALVAAGLAVVVPWMAQSTNVATESIAYPAFAWAVLAIVYAVRTPGVRADGVAIVAIGVACLARTQFFVLAVALPVAIALFELRLAAQDTTGLVIVRRAARRMWEGHRLLIAGAVLGVLLVAVVGLDTLIGSYAVTVQKGSLIPAGFARSVLDHAALVAVGFGALPLLFGVAFALETIWRPEGRGPVALAAVFVVVVPLVTFAVTSFDLRFTSGGGVQERYLFYVVPLVLVAAAGWFRNPARRSPVAIALAAVATGVVVRQQPYVPAPGGFAQFASPNREFFTVLDGRAQQLGSIVGLADLSASVVIAIACLVVAAAAYVARRRRHGTAAAAVVGAGLAVLLLAQLVYVLPRVVGEHNSIALSLFGQRPLEGRDWVDRETPGPVGLVQGVVNARGREPFFNQSVNSAIWWDAEFWNRSVERVYEFRGRDDLTLGPLRHLDLDVRSGDMSTSGRVDPRYLILSASDVRFAPESRGRPVTHGDLTLYRAVVPYRAAWATLGIREDGWTTPGRPARIRLYAARGADDEVVRTRILLQGVGPRRSFTIRAPGVRRTGAVRAKAMTTIEACVPAKSYADIDIDVPGRFELSPGFVVGARVSRIDTVRTGRSCVPAGSGTRR